MSGYDASTNALRQRINAESAQGEVVRLRDALAAARREVETAQAEVRLRGETIDALRREVAGWEERTKKLGSVVLRAWEVLRGWWQFSKLEERDEPFVDSLTRAIAADAEHDAYALGEIRRLNGEVETVTKERDEARAEARTLAIMNETFVEDLATSRAALEDVRRVHTWLSADAYRKVAKGYNEAVAAYLPPSAMPITFRKTAAEAEDFPALGRALAQEAGDAAK